MDAPAFGYVSEDEALSDPSLTQGIEPHMHNEGGPDGSILNGVREETENEYEPDEVIISVPVTSTTGFGPATYYWLPETEMDAAAQNAPFLGFGLEELSIDEWMDVSIILSGISGPGEVVLWQDGMAPDVFFDSVGDSRAFNAGSHTHLNWGFSELGLYALEFTFTGTHFEDGVQTGAATYFFVVPEPSTAALGVIGMLGLLGRRRRC